ncbi:MAG: TlpA family protein disulfide reductase [Gammaproteobacteria bacterium]|nr:TlpA family protein disulfide reductase [Gammaproteobacteria bacterium]
MRLSHRRLTPILKAALTLYLAILSTDYASARNFQIPLQDETEINVEVADASGSLLVVWFIDHDEERPQFEEMLKTINGNGIEVWRVDLLADYFLPRTNENVRTLTGKGVAAVIDAAHEQTDRTIVLAAYDRMPLPLLRGVRDWSGEFQGESRLAGSILYYPNLFGPPPPAGEAPLLDPVVAASNYPVVIVQPANGSQRWRLNDVMQAFWSAEAPAYVSLVPGIRDWFFMHPKGEDPRETRVTEEVPREILRFVSLMKSESKPQSVIGISNSASGQAMVRGLVPFARQSAAPALNLSDTKGSFLFSGYRDKVTLINFWATWCPPCVEELPSLNRLKQRFSEQPFSLISVDFRETEKELLKFTKKVPVEFPILLDLNGQASFEWQVFSFPSSFLIGPDGRIRYSINRAIDWDTPEVYALIESLLEETER